MLILSKWRTLMHTRLPVRGTILSRSSIDCEFGSWLAPSIRHLVVPSGAYLPLLTLPDRSMPADNSEQIAEWNGALGQRWVAMQREIDRIVVPFGDAALIAAAPQPGERVIDIGCGCGDTSIEIARMVGAAGAVVGVDVSQPMLGLLAHAAAVANCAHLSCREGDASEASFRQTRLLFSRVWHSFLASPPKPSAICASRCDREAGTCCLLASPA